jgi:hypothetical protein
MLNKIRFFLISTLKRFIILTKTLVKKVFIHALLYARNRPFLKRIANKALERFPLVRSLLVNMIIHHSFRVKMHIKLDLDLEKNNYLLTSRARDINKKIQARLSNSTKGDK